MAAIKQGHKSSEVNEDAQVIRRQDLTDLGNTFKEALGPVQGLVGLVGDQNALVKETNQQSKDTNRKQKWLGIWLIMLTAGFFMGVVKQVQTSWDQEETAKLQRELIEGGAKVQKDLAAVTTELRGLVKLSKKTGKQVEDIKEEREDEPEVQLIAETDPIKARRAPMKVRIIPPRRKAGAKKDAPPASSAVELSIGRSNVK